MMNTREAKGLAIASGSTLARQSNLWIVPSQTRASKQYTVDLSADPPTCSCADYAECRRECKHIYAVLYALRRESGQPIPVAPPAVVKPTYKQEWHEYNLAQTNEKPRFLELLYELCAGINEPVQTMGRPRMPFSDMVLCAAYKIYSTFSGRRFTGDLQTARERGYIAQVPHFNTVSKYLDLKAMTPYLKQLIVESGLPLKSIETDFAADSSGFATGQFTRWYDVKYGGKEDMRDWLKVHIMCGVRTNVVTSVEVSGRHANDYNYFEPLVEQTARNGFQMKEVSGDKAYPGVGNLATALKHGAIPYIPFKSNSQPDGNGALWARIFHFYNFQRAEFLAHYHKRSNSESTFSMIKAKFGERLRSKSGTGQTNEVLCKILCHNVCCLIQSIYELGVEPTFWTD
jgi:transposase